MSVQSKARRDARKRKAVRERNQARADAPRIEPHAELRDREGNLLAGIVRQSGVWVLGMDGRIAGSTDSAAQVLMLIRRAQRLHDAQGVPVKLVYSDALRDEAELEAAAQGLSLADHEKRLEEEMAAARPAGQDGSDTTH
ncbi:hypothetical protein B1992_08535 [Pseudoxanthomonas broegbernensis]|uniref:Uncharacterized protein n=1 Tax=Pseudoxanthomonas broegbernensis TaxID=83619 RepID=A0A7V8GM39_9GAMM|nr:hypothetical protein [Pseudoxanthomonas broegbernensis]KAF1686265.1 hypothetical protein B1992_08535 [Pseudoxanthomonas broegbernensis]MBB6063943.1 hypothetical protein [Pseudoxanthomonas broegbernensis]